MSAEKYKIPNSESSHSDHSSSSGRRQPAAMDADGILEIRSDAFSPDLRRDSADHVAGSNSSSTSQAYTLGAASGSPGSESSSQRSTERQSSSTRPEGKPSSPGSDSPSQNLQETVKPSQQATQPTLVLKEDGATVAEQEKSQSGLVKVVSTLSAKSADSATGAAAGSDDGLVEIRGVLSITSPRRDKRDSAEPSAVDESRPSTLDMSPRTLEVTGAGSGPNHRSPKSPGTALGTTVKFLSDDDRHPSEPTNLTTKGSFALNAEELLRHRFFDICARYLRNAPDSTVAQKEIEKLSLEDSRAVAAAAMFSMFEFLGETQGTSSANSSHPLWDSRRPSMMTTSQNSEAAQQSVSAGIARPPPLVGPDLSALKLPRSKSHSIVFIGPGVSGVRALRGGALLPGSANGSGSDPPRPPVSTLRHFALKALEGTPKEIHRKYSLDQSTASISGVTPFRLTTTLEQVAEEEAMNPEGYTMVNQYMLLDTIGQGGFSIVHLAFDTGCGEYRALKEMKRPLASSSMMAQIQKEINVMRTLRHKNIVILYEVIDDPQEKKLFLALQYVEKGPIITYRTSDKSLSQAIDPVAMLYYARQMAAGLNYLHNHKIFHRDIKPENVLLGNDDHVYLADFGVSEVVATLKTEEAKSRSTSFARPKAHGGSTSDRKPFLLSGVESEQDLLAQQDGDMGDEPKNGALDGGDPMTLQVEPATGRSRANSTSSASSQTSVHRDHDISVGTPAFLAPEMLRRDPSGSKQSAGAPESPVDLAAADVWALGITFYVLLVGHLPWTPKSQTRPALDSTASSIPPSEMPTPESKALQPDESPPQYPASLVDLWSPQDVPLGQGQGQESEVKGIGQLPWRMYKQCIREAPVVFPEGGRVPAPWQLLIRGMLEKDPTKRLPLSEVRKRIKLLTPADVSGLPPAPQPNRKTNGAPGLRSPVLQPSLLQAQATSVSTDGLPPPSETAIPDETKILVASTPLSDDASPPGFTMRSPDRHFFAQQRTSISHRLREEVEKSRGVTTPNSHNLSPQESPRILPEPVSAPHPSSTQDHSSPIATESTLLPAVLVELSQQTVRDRQSSIDYKAASVSTAMGESSSELPIQKQVTAVPGQLEGTSPSLMKRTEDGAELPIFGDPVEMISMTGSTRQRPSVASSEASTVC